MEREFESKPKEVGQVYLYLQESAFYFQDAQILSGTDMFGRFGSAIAHLGDLNQDGYNGNFSLYYILLQTNCLCTKFSNRLHPETPFLQSFLRTEERLLGEKAK